MSSRLQALEVYCPECGQAINEPCLLAREGRTGRIYRRACHRERHELYQRTKRTNSFGRIARENAVLVKDDNYQEQAGAVGG